MSVTIGNIVLSGAGGDLHWTDEYAEGSDLVGQIERITVTGALVVQASAQQAGRRMTLAGGRDGNTFWGVISRSELEALRALAARPGHEFTVTLADGRQFTAMFRRDGTAVEAEPIIIRHPVQASDFYLPTLRMILI